MKIAVGKIDNTEADSVNAAASQVEVLFDIQSLTHDGLVDSQLYRVSVGALLGDDDLSVAQDEITYESSDTDIMVCLYIACLLEISTHVYVHVGRGGSDMYCYM